MLAWQDYLGETAFPRYCLKMLHTMSPRARRTFVMSWLAGTLLILCAQIVASLTPPSLPGTRNAVLIGPPPVVLAALAVNLVLLALLTRRDPRTVHAITSDRRGRSFGAAVTGMLGSLLTVVALTVAGNLLLTHAGRFSN